MDFRDLLTRYGVPYHAEGRHTRPGWLNLRCPECGKDPYLGYNVAGRYLNCWSCGGISLRRFVAQISGLSGAALADLLAGLPRSAADYTLRVRGTYREPVGVAALTPCHEDYLRARHLDPVQIKRLWRVRGTGQLAGLLKWRLFIPVHCRGQAVSWTTRAIGNIEPRYRSARDTESAIPISELLYGIDYVRGACIIVEGPVDVWALGPGAVATLGLRVAMAQRAQLARVPRRVVCFDNEPGAQLRARRLARDLAVYAGETILVRLESAKDAAAADPQEIEALRTRFLI